MAASFVFRSVLCSCHRVLVNPHPQFASKTYTRAISNSPFKYSDKSSSSNGSVSVNKDESEPIHEVSPMSSEAESALHKFAQVVDKVTAEQAVDERNLRQSEDMIDVSFATMLRNSRLISMGESKDKRVLGKIIEVMEDDLYIDFGGKFHCVCPRPRKNADKYQRGSQVVVNLNSLEMSSAFLGSDIHISLLEADAILLGLHTSRETDIKTSPQ